MSKASRDWKLQAKPKASQGRTQRMGATQALERAEETIERLLTKIEYLELDLRTERCMQQRVAQRMARA